MMRREQGQADPVVRAINELRADNDLRPDSDLRRSRTYSWVPPAILAQVGRGLAGIELLRAVADGRLPKPPIAELIGATITEVDEGRVVFAMEPAEWMYNPIGSVHGGIAATLLDSCMGCAVHSLLPAGVGYTTTDLQVRYVKAMTAATGRVLAEGKIVHSGRRLATAEGRLFEQATGKLIAHGTSSCVILR